MSKSVPRNACVQVSLEASSVSCLFGTSWYELRISSLLGKTVSVVVIFSLSFSFFNQLHGT